MINRLPKIKSTIILFNYRGLIPIDVYPLKKSDVTSKSFNLQPLPKIEYKQFLNSFRQLSPSETQHSCILCDLINPHNPANDHGKLFLELFFKYVLNDRQFEYGENDDWEVTAEQERYDIRIRNRNNSKIIIIENKSNLAFDQPNQLYRYWYYGIHLLQKDMDKKYAKILYLSPSEFKKYEKQSITKPDYFKDIQNEDPDSQLADRLDEAIIKIVYFNQEILTWLDKCIEALEEKDNLFYYLLQYKDFWENTMTNTIVKQVETFFSDKEQWDTFLELHYNIGEISSQWYLTLKNALTQRFLTESIDNAWGFISWGRYNTEYLWFLNEYRSDCFCIWQVQQSIQLWISPDNIDLPKATALLKTNKYSKILAAFERMDEPHLEEPQYPYKMVERGNFTFGDIDDGHISPDKFAWYAHYKTDIVVEQILRKVNRFRENGVTTLIKELIEETKK
jgi:hypothetical protein